MNILNVNGGFHSSLGQNPTTSQEHLFGSKNTSIASGLDNQIPRRSNSGAPSNGGTLPKKLFGFDISELKKLTSLFSDYINPEATKEKRINSLNVILKEAKNYDHKVSYKIKIVLHMMCTQEGKNLLKIENNAPTQDQFNSMLSTMYSDDFDEIIKLYLKTYPKTFLPNMQEYAMIIDSSLVPSEQASRKNYENNLSADSSFIDLIRNANRICDGNKFYKISNKSDKVNTNKNRVKETSRQDWPLKTGHNTSSIKGNEYRNAKENGVEGFFKLTKKLTVGKSTESLYENEKIIADEINNHYKNIDEADRKSLTHFFEWCSNIPAEIAHTEFGLNKNSPTSEYMEMWEKLYYSEEYQNTCGQLIETNNNKAANTGIALEDLMSKFENNLSTPYSFSLADRDVTQQKDAVQKNIPSDNNLPPENNSDIKTRSVKKPSFFDRTKMRIMVTGYVLLRVGQILAGILRIIRSNMSAESIEKLASSSGGIIVKILQFVVSSKGLSRLAFGPNYKDYMEKLKHVSGSNKPMSETELKNCLKKANISYDKTNFTVKNLGVGSIGQVDKIRLSTGEYAVIKTIAPKKEARTRADIKIIKGLLTITSFFKKGLIPSGIKNAFCEIIDSVKEEFDLQLELKNTVEQSKAFKKISQKGSFNLQQSDLPLHSTDLPVNVENQFSDYITFKVPEIKSEFSTAKTLGMEEINGFSLSKENEYKISKMIADLIEKNPWAANQFIEEFKSRSCLGSDQEFVAQLRVKDSRQSKEVRNAIKSIAYSHWQYCFAQTGFYNADIHDGNIMVSVEDNKIAIYFIDLGNAHQISRDEVIAAFGFGGNIHELTTTHDADIQKACAKNISNCLKTLCHGQNDKNFEALEQAILLKASSLDGDNDEQISKVFDLAYEHNIHLPVTVASMLRALILFNSQ